MTVAELSTADLYLMMVSSAIFGGVFAAISILAVVRYSRAEESGIIRPKFFPDLFLALCACAFVLGGMWRAGLFG